MTSTKYPSYNVLIHDKTRNDLSLYLMQLVNGEVLAGKFLNQQIKKAGFENLSVLDTKKLLNLLLRTKKPQIFAETAVYGDGTDWNRQELKLLGDISIACKVMIYDDGHHLNPMVYDLPFEGYLLFTPGALLRNGRGQMPADWDVVNDDDGQIDMERYYALYERRLLPMLNFANAESKRADKQAVITIPGLGCGQFAGKFLGQLGEKLETVLERILRTYRSQFDSIALIFFDPYKECTPKTIDIDGLPLVVNPQTKSNIKLNQLSYPHLLTTSENSENLLLFSFVAWDHVSWPGNDFYLGSRVTDDGVKAAATNSMQIITGIEGFYDIDENCYLPPRTFDTWFKVVGHYELVLVNNDF